MTKDDAARLAVLYAGDPNAIVQSIEPGDNGRWSVTLLGALNLPTDGPTGVARRRGQTCHAATITLDAGAIVSDEARPEPLAVEAWDWH